MSQIASYYLKLLHIISCCFTLSNHNFISSHFTSYDLILLHFVSSRFTLSSVTFHILSVSLYKSLYIVSGCFRLSHVTSHDLKLLLWILSCFIFFQVAVLPNVDLYYLKSLHFITSRLSQGTSHYLITTLSQIISLNIISFCSILAQVTSHYLMLLYVIYVDLYYLKSLHIISSPYFNYFAISKLLLVLSSCFTLYNYIISS